MPFCDKCGAPVGFGKKYCPECGTAMDGSGKRKKQETQTEYKSPYQEQAPKSTFHTHSGGPKQAPDYTVNYSAEDIQANKGFAVLAYLGILCLVPIFCAKNSPYARFHANQGLALLLSDIVVSFVISLITRISGIFFAMNPLNLIFSALAIVGIINAAKGSAKPLPVIGGFKILS